MEWQLYLLGEWQLVRGSTNVGADLPKKSKALLAVLALSVGTPVPRARLADMLWSARDERHSRHSLSQALSTLRRTLPEDFGLLVTEDRIALDVSSISVDALELETRVGLPELDDWRRALALYRGDFLESLEIRSAKFEAWVLVERERIRQVVQRLSRKLVHALIDRNEIVEAAEIVERLARAAPADEWLATVLQRQRLGPEKVAPASGEKEPLPVHPGPIERDRVLARMPEPGLAESMAPFRPLDLPPEPFDALPTVAVLPLEPISDGRNAVFEAMAISNELHAGLARFPQIRVISRHSSFRYGRRAVDTRVVGRLLGCRYLVDGTVAIDGRRHRYLTQLIDAHSGLVVWSDRQTIYGDELAQARDELCQQIVAILANRVIKIDSNRRRVTTERQRAALDSVQRGERILHVYGPETNRRARQLFERAAALDPDCAVAVALIGRTHSLDWRYGWTEDKDRAAALSLEMAELAVAIDDTEPRAYAELGWARLYNRNIEGSIAAYESAHRLLPNDPDIIGLMADTVSYGGDPARALRMAERARLLQPAFPDRTLWSEADALFALKRYPEVIQTIKSMEDPTEGCRLCAASYAYMGDHANAHRMATMVRHRQPGFRVDDWVGMQPEAIESEREHFREGLIRAGLR